MKEKIVILGSGESGLGAVLLAKKNDFAVFLSDINKIDDEVKKTLRELDVPWEENQHTLAKMLDAAWVVKSPGIPNHSTIIKSLIEKGLKIISEIEFASRFTEATLVGITGSNGKTTTSLMTYDILKNAGFNVGLAGNIGSSFARQVATKKHDFYVLEISSFQLDDIIDFNPHFAVLTNIIPDHLDRYNNKFEQYIQSKMRITENQTNKEFLLFNADDNVLQEAINTSNSKAQQFSFGTRQPATTHFEDNHIIINNHQTTDMINTDSISFSGRHNLLNALAASTIASLLEVSKDAIRESLLHFKGAPHRMENVLEIQKVQYINDSKATNVNATYFALESVKRPLVWIVGGVDKGNDYSCLLPLVREKVKGIICLGQDNEKIKEVFGGVIDFMFETQSITEAVKVAHKITQPKEAVLLSPACASFDLFENYEDRGNQFKKAIRNL